MNAKIFTEKTLLKREAIFFTEHSLTRRLNLAADLCDLCLQLGECLLALGGHAQLQHVHLVLHLG
jgi:hypothetical protein